MGSGGDGDGSTSSSSSSSSGGGLEGGWGGDTTGGTDGMGLA